MVIKLPRNLRRKAEKIALAFEYVHDRFLGLPSYWQRFGTIGLRYGLPLLLIILIGTLPLWGSSAKHIAQESTIRIKRIVQNLLPEPPPVVLADAAARGANTKWQDVAQEKWQREIAKVSIQGGSLLSSIQERLGRTPELFFPGLDLDFSPLWRFQADAAQPYKNIVAAAPKNLRSFVLPFVQNEADFPSRVESEVALLHALDNFNRINIPQLLEKSADRTQPLEEFLIRGKNLQQSGRRAYVNIVARRQRFADLEERLQESADGQEVAIVDALDSFAATRAEERLENFVSTRQKEVLSTAEAAFLSQLEERFRLELTALDLRVDGVEKNRAALIANVVVTPVEGVDLGLIQGAEERNRIRSLFGS